MGRHAADDGAAVHPLVAAALEQRPTAVEPTRPRHVSSAPRAADEQPDGLGWPGEPGDGTGLGWPAAGSATDLGAPAERPSDEPPARRRGWRRLFGGGSPGPAAGRPRTSDAA